MPAAAGFAMLIQVGSFSRLTPALLKPGLVPVTQSTIFFSPVLVVFSDGWDRSTPLSMMPTVTPRPSNCGFCSTNWAAPVSPVGM
jgi:hypothetical protein